MSEIVNPGLTTAEVAERVAAGLTNKQDNSSSRSFTSILRANFFTLFNAIVGGSFLALLLLGQWKDALFGLAVISNILIGVIQEYRSKRTLDKISLLHAPHARARRNGELVDLKLEEIVMDDLLELRAGDQLLADAEVVYSDGLELDESILTGESEPVEKEIGSTLLASSAVSAGRGLARVTRVGSNTYASKITLEAKKFSMVTSELRNAINKVIKWISYALLPFVLLVANGQMQAHGGWVQAIQDGTWLEATVAGIASVIAFVPQGLVLITSITFAVAAINTAGSSAAKVSKAATPSTTPGAPTIGTTAQTSATSLTVNWTAPTSTGGSAITGYEIKVYSGGLQVGTAKTAAATAKTLAVTGLTTKTAYTFTVAAKNVNGTGTASAASTAVSTK
ncbi:MAG: hypothetical protein RL545_160 [Actinomycetota bacterium]